jgi:hypothetical protein
MAKKTEVEEISFRPATGGAVSDVRTKTRRGGQGGGPDYDYDHQTAVHATLEHAQAHLAKHLGDCFGSSEAAGKTTEKE